MSFPLNELQIKLGYKFENIQLLHEALTHDFDSKNTQWDIFGDGNVFYPKRKLHRLKCVGVSVLKLLIAELAVLSQNEICPRLYDEGYVTRICIQFNEQCRFDEVGRHLKLWKCIHSRNCVDVTNSSIIKEVIQAIFGAVFIDGGGSESKNNYAIEAAREVFYVLKNKYNFNSKSHRYREGLHDCFDVSHHFVRELLQEKRYAFKIKFYKSPEKKLKYRFEDPDLIKTALTHDSVKSYIPDVLHYEILEFLGDAVYELVICDYLFWHYINDRDGQVFNFQTLTKFVSKKFQEEIAKGLNLQLYIIKADHVKVNDVHDFVESIVGAIYVDAKSLKPVNKVLVELCRLFEMEMIINCNTRLPFTLRTYYGSTHYIPVPQLNYIKEEHSWPPRRLDTFEIKNLEKVKLLLGDYYNHHKLSGTIQSYNSSAKVLGSESWCNQQEFGRTNLYETIIRIQYLDQKVYLWDTGKILLKNHTYHDFYKEYPRIQSEVKRIRSVDENNYIIGEVSFRHVTHIINLWIRKWVPDFQQLCKVIKTTIDIVGGLLSLGFFI